MPRATPFARIVVEHAFVALTNGIAADLHRRGALRDADDQRAAIFQTAQAVLFRIVFLFFAESRRMLPLTHPAYANHSVRRLLEEMAAQLSLGEDDFWAWEWLQALLAAAQTGQPEWSVPRCGDIGLSPNALENVRIDTCHLSIALDVLGYDEATHQLRDYANIDVRLLGEIYERLLSCELVQRPSVDIGIDERRKAKDESPHVLRSSSDAEALPLFALQYTRAGQRASGSFYTPHLLVKQLVEQTVGPPLSERIARFEAGSMESDLLDFTLLDPAMGCGTFLLAAVDFIAERLRGVHAYIGSDERSLRHEIVQRCIYGVDIEQGAVEVARLGLWLDCCVAGTPLDVFDRRLRCGNSLIGGWLNELDDNSLSDLQAGLKLLRSAPLIDDHYTLDAAYERLTAPIGLLLDREVSDKQHHGARKHRFLHWELAFPTIFFDLARGVRKPPEHAGFDVVIGNPPYLTTLDRWERAYLAARSITRGRELDTCYLFVEQALRILRPSGRCGMVMPAVWATQSEAEPFRKYLLEHTLLDLHILGFNVFGATVPVSTFVLARCTPAVNHLVAIRLQDGLERMVPQSVFRSLPQTQFNPQLVDTLPLIQRVEAVSVPLATYAESHEGVHSGNIRHKLFTRTPTSSARSVKRMLKGADIGRYSLQWNGWYVNYDSTLIGRSAGEYASLRHERIFTQPKIWTRQTSDGIIATWDAEGFYSDNTLHSTQLLPGASISPLYLLALLNSRLLTFIYRQRTQEQGRPLAQVKLIFLRQLPIRRIAFSTPQAKRTQWVAEARVLFASLIERTEPATLADIGIELQQMSHDIIHDLLVLLAEQMLDLTCRQQLETKTCIDWLATELHSDITTWKGKTIVQTYWAQPWERIEVTLRRNTSEAILRPLLATIRAHWETSCATLAPLHTATKTTDRLIDLLVYRLYGLDEAEIALVEGGEA